MAEIRDWIEEQEAGLLVEGAGSNGEAIKMLEHSETNRDLSSRQARLHVLAQFMAETYGLKLYLDLLDDCEHAQIHVDNQGRIYFKQIAIEQWQGRLNSKKDSTLRALV